jgi:F-type H+-transporting ATPase subunit b
VVVLGLAGGAIQLVPDGTLIFHLAIIVLMVALLNVTLLKPINRILQARERRTKGRLTEAQDILANVSAKMAEYEVRLREARAEGYALLEEERATASRERERKVAEIKIEVNVWVREQKEKLRMNAEGIKVRLEQDAKAMALEIGRQILHRELADRSRN